VAQLNNEKIDFSYDRVNLKSGTIIGGRTIDYEVGYADE
jgi:hypothetical protein